MSSNGLYVAPPRLRMQCGLPPTMEDTSYPEKGKKKSQKGNAKRRMYRRNAANKGAKAQNKAGSPQAAEEPPNAALELTAKDAEVHSLPGANRRNEVNETSESSEKEGAAPPCRGGPSIDEKLASTSAKAEETKEPMRQPKNQLAQIEALLRTMNPNKTNPPAPPQGNGRTNFRGTRPKYEGHNKPNTRPEPTRKGDYLSPSDPSRQQPSQPHRSVTNSPQAQIVTMDASKPEADPVHLNSENASTSRFPIATQGNTDSQHSCYQNTNSTTTPTTPRTTPNIHNHPIASPTSLVTSGGTDLGVKPADPFVKPQPSAAGTHTHTSTSPIPASSDVPGSFLNVPQQETTPKHYVTLPHGTTKPSSPLKREYDANGNYIPPHMRTPKDEVKVQHSPNGDSTLSPLKEISHNLNSTLVSPSVNQESIPKPVSDSKDQETVTEPASAMAEVARITHGETEQASTKSAEEPPIPEASVQTSQKVSIADEAGRDEATIAPKVEPVVQEITEKANVESIAKEDCASFQTPPGPSKVTLVDGNTTSPSGAVARDIINENTTHPTKPRATTPSPNPRTPQKSTIVKNSAGSPGASPFAGPSKQPGTRRPSPFAKSPKPAGKQSPKDFVWDDRKAKWSYNSDFGGTEGGVREMEDEDDGLRLQDWDGKWMAAPVEWDARPCFNNVSAKFAASVNKWIDEESAKGVSVVDMNQRGFLEGVALGTGTDKAWEIIAEEDQGDTQLYPEDDYTPTKLEQTSKASMIAYTAKIEVKEKEQKADRRAIRAANKAHRETPYVPPPNLHVPKANIYIRPAHVGDLNQIKDIYAWYVSNTVVAPERELLDRTAWQNRMQDVDDCKLPFLVAVTKNNRNNSRYNRRYANYREVIVGFGFADLFAGQFDAFKYAVEMQVFVHHQHKRVGIGKTLVDRLLSALDPQHMSRNGTEFFAENTLDYEQGGRRLVGRILATIPYDPTNDSDFQWQKKWLAEWDFDLVATLPKIGYKKDKFLNFAYLLKQTGVTIGPGCGM